MMGVGIAGVNGTGKRDLAEAYADETGHILVAIDSDKLLRKTRSKFTVAGTIKEYRVALDELESFYLRAQDRFITDTTPIDVMAELYSLFTWFNEPAKVDGDQVDALWFNACRICSRYLIAIMHIKPLGADVRREHLNALGAGLIHTRLVNEVETKMFTVNRNMVELDQRIGALKTFVFAQYEARSPYKSTSSLKH